MKTRLGLGVGAHEPIFHRLRTGNSTAEEWERWKRETSTENLDLLEKLGVTSANIACSKGFGLEFEKPIIERAAKFAVAAEKRGIATSIYVQGFPVYYEAFMLETPEAEGWLARNQHGDFIPWGGQTFRRWMDFTSEAFFEYECRLLEYILGQYPFVHFGMDNTVPPAPYTRSARESFRQHLKDKFDSEAALREFGIPGFDAVDLPVFDPIYFPPDAIQIVKDPLLQEWARWRSWGSARFRSRIKDFLKSITPECRLSSAAGCGGLRYNHLFRAGIDFEDVIESVDHTHMEESCWRPAVFGPSTQQGSAKAVMDERHPDAVKAEAAGGLRVSTDSRFMKILQHYGMGGGRGLWGERDRPSKLRALSHSMAFGWNADSIGTIAPLAADPRMLEEFQDLLDWAGKNLDIISGRGARVAPIAVWRGTATIGFIRHRPVWEACAVEQMLYENHLPFTILFDGGIERFMAGVKVLVLPGTACVSARQVEIITEFVRSGGKLLLLGEAGTRDEWTRLRMRHAFEHLFGGKLPDLEFNGPPHWVPTLDFGRVPETLSAEFGQGSVALVKSIQPVRELDLTRDVYMPERQVMAKDILPPKNEEQIMQALMGLYGESSLRLDAPRTTLCEYWTHGEDLLVCMVNLRTDADGGPVTLRLGRDGTEARVRQLFDDGVRTVPVTGGAVSIDRLPHFCAIEVRGALA